MLQNGQNPGQAKAVGAVNYRGPALILALHAVFLARIKCAVSQASLPKHGTCKARHLQSLEKSWVQIAANSMPALNPGRPARLCFFSKCAKLVFALQCAG